MTKELLYKYNADKKGAKISHAIVIFAQYEDTYKIKNSWGEEFGNKNFFLINKSALLDCSIKFMHIFHEYNKLSD